MRVVTLIPNHAPHFGVSWAKAASFAADSITLEVAPRPVLQQRSHGVFSDGRSYQVERIDLRPSRFMYPLSRRIMAARIDRALGWIEKDHGSVDIVHSHYYHQALAIPNIREASTFVHTEHSSAMLTGLMRSGASFPLSKEGSRIARAVYQRATVLAVSEYLAESMSHLDLSEGPYQVVGNPIDTERFSYLGRAEEDVVIAVGRLASDKRFDLAIQAFALVAPSFPELRFEIIGEGSQLPRLQGIVRDLNLDQRVHFMGRMSPQEIAFRLQVARGFVSTSQSETFGVAIAEALACGVPVIAPDNSAIPELVNGANGALVTEPSPESFAAAITSVLDTTWERAAIAREVASRFGYEAIGARLSNVYASALASS